MNCPFFMIILLLGFRRTFLEKSTLSEHESQISKVNGECLSHYLFGQLFTYNHKDYSICLTLLRSKSSHWFPVPLLQGEGC